MVQFYLKLFLYYTLLNYKCVFGFRWPEWRNLATWEAWAPVMSKNEQKPILLCFPFDSESFGIIFLVEFHI